MPQEEFQTNVNAVVELFLEKNKNLGEESSKYWNEITNQCYKFKRYQMIAEYVKNSMSFDSVLSFFDSFMAKGSPNRRKLSIQVFCTNHMSSIDDEVSSDRELTMIAYDSIPVFQSGVECYPSFTEMSLASYLPN
jgi:secreted Zn-dependent insulinase-like peptidase